MDLASYSPLRVLVGTLWLAWPSDVRNDVANSSASLRPEPLGGDQGSASNH